MKKIIIIFVLLGILNCLNGLKEVDKLSNRSSYLEKESYHYQIVNGDPNYKLNLWESIYLIISGEIKAENEIGDSLVIIKELKNSYETTKTTHLYYRGNYLRDNLNLVLSVYGQYESKLLYTSIFNMDFRKVRDEPIADENFNIASYNFSTLLSQEEISEITNQKLKNYLSPYLPLEKDRYLKITIDYFKNGLMGKEECDNVTATFGLVDIRRIYVSTLAETIRVESKPRIIRQKCPGAMTFFSAYASFGKTFMRKGIEDGSNDIVQFDSKWDDKRSDDEILNFRVARGYYKNRWFAQVEGRIIDRVFDGNIYGGFETVFKDRFHWHFGMCTQQRRFSFYLAGEPQNNVTYYYQKKPWVSYYVGFFSKIDFWFGVKESQFQKQLKKMGVNLPLKGKYESFVSLHAEVNSQPWKVWEDPKLTKWLIKLEAKLKPKLLYSYFNVEYKEFSSEEIIFEGSIFEKPLEKTFYAHSRFGLGEKFCPFGFGQYINHSIYESVDINHSNFQLWDLGFGAEWEIPSWEITVMFSYRETIERMDIGKPWGKEFHNQGIVFLIKLVKTEVRL